MEPTKPWSPDWLSRKFARHAVKHGFDGVSLHWLRHTAATLWLLNGAPVHVVAARLGHHSPTVYAHVIGRSEDQVAEMAGTVLKGVIPTGSK